MKVIRLIDMFKIFTLPFIQKPFFTNRVFQIFDKDNSGSISLQEFIDAIHQFAGQSPEDKIKFLFKVYDIDGKWKRICIEITLDAQNIARIFKMLECCGDEC